MKTSPEERAKILLDKIGKEAFSFTEASWSNTLIEELTELITKADALDWLNENRFYDSINGLKTIIYCDKSLLTAIQNA